MSRIITPGPAAYSHGADNTINVQRGKTLVASPESSAKVQVITRDTNTESFVSVSDTAVPYRQGDMTMALKQQTHGGRTQTVVEVRDDGRDPDDGDKAVVRIPLGVDVTGGMGEKALKWIKLPQGLRHVKVDKSNSANPRLIVQGQDNQVNTIVSFEAGDFEVTEKRLHPPLEDARRFKQGLVTGSNEFTPYLKACQDGRLGPEDETNSGFHHGLVASGVIDIHQRRSDDDKFYRDRSAHPAFMVERLSGGDLRATSQNLDVNPVTGEERDDAWRLPENQDLFGIEVKMDADSHSWRDTGLYAFALTEDRGRARVETVDIARTPSNEIVVRQQFGEFGKQFDPEKSRYAESLRGEEREWTLSEAEAFAITAGLPETYRK